MLALYIFERKLRHDLELGELGILLVNVEYKWSM